MLLRVIWIIFLLPIMVYAEPLDQVVAVVNDGVITTTELEAEVSSTKQQLLAKQAAMPSDDILRI